MTDFQKLKDLFERSYLIGLAYFFEDKIPDELSDTIVLALSPPKILLK